MRNQDTYLMRRNERYHYERRTPREYANFDKRRYIRKSLKTTSIDVARARRDALVEADDLFWAGVSSAADDVSSDGRQAKQASLPSSGMRGQSEGLWQGGLCIRPTAS